MLHLVNLQNKQLKDLVVINTTRLVVNSIIKDSTNDRTNLAISEVELIGKIEVESSPVNNTTLVVANSKGIRVTHDKANIKAFTFPVDFNY